MTRNERWILAALICLIALVPVVLVVVAMAVELPIVARGGARVVADGKTIAVEAQFRGRLDRITVEEGELVEAGHVVAHLASIDLEAEAQDTWGRVLAARLRIARLNAERTETAFVPPSDDQLLGDDGITVVEPASLAAVVRAESERASARLLEHRSRLAQFVSEAELARVDAGKAATAAGGLARELDLLTEQISISRKTGRMSRTAELDMERERARLGRELEEAEFAQAAAERAIEEIAARRETYLAERARRMSEEVSEAAHELATLTRSSRAARERRQANLLVAPRKGIVATIDAPPGSVVNPGEPVLGIVPITDRVAIDARIAAQDIAGVRHGLSATVRLDAVPFEVHGGLDGKVIAMSPDTVEDPRTGGRFFLVRIAAERRVFETERGEVAVTPGLSGTAEIQVGHRRVIDYFLRPVLGVANNAWRE
jgi:HlyD family type I secretion membrane fusion protein